MNEWQMGCDLSNIYAKHDQSRAHDIYQESIIPERSTVDDTMNEGSDLLDLGTPCFLPFFDGFGLDVEEGGRHYRLVLQDPYSQTRAHLRSLRRTGVQAGQAAAGVMPKGPHHRLRHWNKVCRQAL